MSEALVVRLEGYEGPLDLLLELARAQKVDLARISVLALVEQFLAVLGAAPRLELAADWLVMAAWLAWLKSRLLVPDSPDAAEAEVAAEVLASRIADLAGARALAGWLAARPRLGEAVFARGAAEELTETDRTGLRVSLPALLAAYVGGRRRASAKVAYVPAPPPAYSVRDALERLAAFLGGRPGWSELGATLPLTEDRRGAFAATLVAALELAREGRVTLRQDFAFAPVFVRPGS